MAGYAAMARVRGGRVRALAWEGAPGWADEAVPTSAIAHDGALNGRVMPALVDARPSPTLGDRWDAFREELGMMTFYLLDPESWR